MQQLYPEPGMPYIFTGNHNCYSNDTLQFMPGTIVKFMDGKQIKSRGKIIANQTIFTSIYDDEHDGHTNNDKEATSPEAGNWGGFEANYSDGRIELDGCTLHYGGHSTSNTFV